MSDSFAFGAAGMVHVPVAQLEASICSTAIMQPEIVTEVGSPHAGVPEVSLPK